MKSQSILLTLTAALCLLAISSGFGQATDYVPGQILIQFKSGKSNTQKSTFKNQINATTLKTFPQLNTELLEINTNTKSADIEQLIGIYSQHPDVESVQPNYIYSLQSTPDDPNFNTLWGLNNTGQTNGTTDVDIDAPEAWDITTGSPSIVVGITDTGIDWQHEDLVENIWQNLGEDADGDGRVLEWNGTTWIFDPGDQNGWDDDGNGYPDDFIGWDFRNDDNNPLDGHSHGTHVAGTIGAQGNNGIGITGVTWEVQLAALKFMSDEGLGTTADAILALDYAVNMGMPLTNNSWGGFSYDTAFEKAIIRARDAGHIFVTAAGNHGLNSDLTQVYPASYDLDNIITATAIDDNDNVPDFANYGANNVDLAAPGKGIYSCLPTNGYASANGTSSGAPHVTGACALLLEEYPDKSYLDIKNAILSSVVTTPELTGKCQSNGRLNLYNTLTFFDLPNCRHDDSLALVALYNATNGVNWLNSWNLNQSMDTWYGVTLSNHGCVVKLLLYQNNLNGNIPAQIGDLRNIVEINLGRNKLSGNLPPEIGDLRQLEYLGLGGNELLSGNIPVELSQLTNLKNLGLGGNQFTGSIPSQFGNLTNLTQLWLDFNSLSGTLPEELGNLYKLTHLMISDNNFEASLPAELARLDKLKFWNLSNNNFSGCFDAGLEVLCDRLHYDSNTNERVSDGNNFDITWDQFCIQGSCNPYSSCRTTDSLALVALYNATNGSSWTNSWNLHQPIDTWHGVITLNGYGCVVDLNLYQNNLIGNIPPEIGDFYNLEAINFGINQLSASLPSEIGNLHQLKYLGLGGNQLSGNIPIEIGSLSNLKNLGLGGNQFTGSLPAEIGNLSNLEQLWLNDNPLSGSIPPELGKLHKLTHLIMPENDFSGSLPPELSQLSSLRYWNLSNNNLSGCFHPDLAVLCSSLHPDFSKNEYVNEGNSFDTNWENFCNNTSPPCDCRYVDSLALVKLYHATNGENWNIKWDLTQPYTSWYGLVFNADACVSEIVFEANNLNGILPSEIGDFEYLTGIEMNSNQLHGTLPPELGKLSNLTLLWLPDNQFTGSIPPEFANLTNLTRFSVAQNQMSGCFAPELANLCSQVTEGATDGNSFDASWEDFCVTQAGICSKYSACRQADSLALVELYNATNGPNWKNTWNLTQPLEEWHGVELNENGCVFTLNLFDNQLSGTIPPQLGNLAYLEILNLGINELTGSIPPQIGDLEHLEILYLADNELNGSIPSELGNLHALTEMNIGINPLTGSIPPSLGNLTKLIDLHIHKTQISGSIPSELGNLTQLRYMYMYENQLSGSIPPTLGNLTKLEILHLGVNQLSNSIPSELGDLNNLETLYLYTNQLSGNIPPKLGNLQALVKMNIGQNPLTGSIPSEIGNLRSLVSLHIHYTQVTGSIPSEIGNLSHLRYLYMYKNDFLTGSIPPQIGNLTNLELLNLSLNQLTGSIPSELGHLKNLETLYLYTNQLSGTIPPQLGDLQALIKMNIGQNPLTGNIPTEIGNLYNLESLHIHETQVTGSITSELSNLTKLRALYISRNKLSGNIPPELSNLTGLEVLQLGYNQLSGSIPDEFANLTNLIHLYINNNQLTGNIPTSFGNLKKLERLDLHVNQLSGSIPATFGGLYKLTTLYLFNNQLSGCYTNLTNLCSQLSNTSGISNGNNFDVSWEDFCNEGLGVCPDLVWPGDANSNGIVELDDFLYIGLANGNTDTPRPNASTNWTGQSCPEWQTNVNGINGKHQDTDGNGLVDTSDFQLVIDNLGKIHTSGFFNSVPSITVFKPDNFVITDNGGSYHMQYDLYLESDGQPIEAHGISTIIDFGELPVTEAYIDVSISSLQPHEEYNVFDANTNTLSIALTRTDQANRSIAGPIATIYSVIGTKNLPTGEGIDFDKGNLITADGTIQPLSNTTFYSPMIINEDVDIQSEEFVVRVNVTHEQCTIPGKVTTQITGGTAPYTYIWSTGDSTPQINNLIAGTYTITVNDASGTEKVMTVEVEKNYVPVYDENGNLADCNTIPQIKPELHLALEGPYSPLTGTMSTNLQQLNMLPDRQPYHQAPYNYQGIEGMNWNAEDYPSGTVDWVLVSFRTEPTADTEVAKAAAILLQDGRLHFLNDYMPLTRYADSLYVNIKHRNHIAVITPEPVRIIDYTLTYDFRANNSYRTPASSGQKQLADGTWLMFAGDANKDVLGYDINGADKGIWSANNGMFRHYIAPDFNLDGDINGADKSLWFSNNGISSSVPK